MNPESASPRSHRVLVVDDDIVFAQVLARALAARGFSPSVAHDAKQALSQCRDERPGHVVLDLKLGPDNGLNLIPELTAIAPDMRILLLTGYASLATAVEAIKRGAHDYLAKPVDADAVASVLRGDVAGDVDGPIAPETPPPLKRLEWEQIQRVLADCDGNVSEAARRLGLYRRTLQRKLAKRPSRTAAT